MLDLLCLVLNILNTKVLVNRYMLRIGSSILLLGYPL